MLRAKIFRYKAVAISWLLIMSILFFLPGSALPKENWLDLVYFDKWVHIGLFAMLIFLWRSSFARESNYYNFFLILFALIYGIGVEFIQRNWIPNRSFDLYDVIADFVGSIIGFLIWLSVYKKNKPL
jgi:VanZ family protein